ncbi:hypothetical protein A3H16_01245 [Candidatus Kaiserbacteria bacterium RIFCSPLOWO2_12_FULL_53_8]|uniref:DoxX family protein n=2 Tax=Candidatus Kaiseribacteriota TaxID=1752734 RepID=A0A1F6CTA6_9BACT|nr:MAG: hypothetical protein A2851_05080 [Candidatus Kaiserbacteria bacterium RIFCSPHIGHO2_01_FULL_53_29]OGG91040.1 MAG: hypothetical protein A3H16_01245 [Candidatus Kaiserbacteria bacterium RIFCSPLOWO2_12_FULL_53_8]
MLSLFPQLLFLAPFSATLLRIAAAVVFFSIAWTHWQKREQLGDIEFIVVGKGTWIPTFAAALEFLIAVGLFLGMYVQLVAILGALAALKALIWKRRYSVMIPISRTASALVFVICLSLVFTGAGAFAFDLPL